MARFETFFMPMEGGGRFCVLHRPFDRVARGAMLFVHPFAEEMNKSRRMAALQARALANAGWVVLQIDLYGCGDSEGDFGDASWDRWVQDVREGAAWLRRETRHTPILWGLRAGCLIALEAAHGGEYMPDLLLWHPVFSGKQALQQFLRVEVASQMLGSPDAPRTGTQSLRDLLASGEKVEVAGYELSPELAAGMQAAELRAPHSPCRTVWLEMSAAEANEMSPAARMRIESWQKAGHDIDAKAVEGPAFWQTQEISECAALIRTTVDAVGKLR